MDAAAERMQRWFDLPVLIAALLTVPLIVIEESDYGQPWDAIGVVLNWGTWLVFVAEVVVMLAVVADRKRWVRDNPIAVTVTILTPPFLPALWSSAPAPPSPSADAPARGLRAPGLHCPGCEVRGLARRPVRNRRWRGLRGARGPLDGRRDLLGADHHDDGWEQHLPHYRGLESLDHRAHACRDQLRRDPDRRDRGAVPRTGR